MAMNQALRRPTLYQMVKNMIRILKIRKGSVILISVLEIPMICIRAVTMLDTGTGDLETKYDL